MRRNEGLDKFARMSESKLVNPDRILPVLKQTPAKMPFDFRPTKLVINTTSQPCGLFVIKVVVIGALHDPLEAS